MRKSVNFCDRPATRLRNGSAGSRFHPTVNGGGPAWRQWSAIAPVPAAGVGLWRKLGMGEQLTAAEARQSIHDGAPVRPPLPPAAPPKGPAPRLDRAA